MELNVRAIAIAHAAVAGILFVLCRLLFTLAPEIMHAANRYLFHADWSEVAVPMTWGGFFLGLVVFTAFMSVVGATWAWIYNYMAREATVASVQPTTIKHERAAA